MKKPKQQKISYEVLVGLKKKVLLAMQVARQDGLQNWKGGLMVKQMQSSLWLYGGVAPKELEDLLSFHHLYQVRFSWLKILTPYYQAFLPHLTQKKMWEIIKGRREVYGQYKRKQEERKQARTTPCWRQAERNIPFVADDGIQRLDCMPRTKHSNNYERLAPMPTHKYVEFILSIPPRRRDKISTQYSICSDSWYELRQNEPNKKLEHLAILEERTSLRISDVCVIDHQHTYDIPTWRIMIGRGGRLFFDDYPSYYSVTLKHWMTKQGREKADAVEDAFKKTEE